jgi:hypothetical protein
VARARNGPIVQSAAGAQNYGDGRTDEVQGDGGQKRNEEGKGKGNEIRRRGSGEGDGGLGRQWNVHAGRDWHREGTKFVFFYCQIFSFLSSVSLFD